MLGTHIQSLCAANKNMQKPIQVQAIVLFFRIQSKRKKRSHLYAQRFKTENDRDHESFLMNYLHRLNYGMDHAINDVK